MPRPIVLSRALGVGEKGEVARVAVDGIHPYRVGPSEKDDKSMR